MEWRRGPVIGRGSSATVYLATTAAGDLFAVKSGDLSSSIFLQKEQRFLSRLNSPYVISYKGFDINYNHNKPTYNLFMEFAGGGTISDVIRNHGGSLNESLIRSYTHQILLGLNYLHSKNLVHCDLKCENILVGEDGVKIGDLGCTKMVESVKFEFSGVPESMAPEVEEEDNLVHCYVGCESVLLGEKGVKIGDLGCAKMVENAKFEFSGTPEFMAPEVEEQDNLGHCDVKYENILLGEKGVKIGDLGCAKIVEKEKFVFSGTPVFMAPEVARGEEQLFAADVWALGCVVIEMATGSNPWPEMHDPVSALYRIGFSGDLPEFPRWLSPEAKDFLTKSLRRDPKERWTTEQLLLHPFVDNSNPHFIKVENFTKSSPTSILDQDFWSSLEVSENSLAEIPTVKFSGKSPVERMNRLIEASASINQSLPDWVDEESWILIRSNQTKENFKMSGWIQPSLFSDFRVEKMGGFDYLMMENHHVECGNQSVTNEFVSRFFDFDNTIDDDYLLLGAYLYDVSYITYIVCYKINIVPLFCCRKIGFPTICKL